MGCGTFGLRSSLVASNNFGSTRSFSFITSSEADGSTSKLVIEYLKKVGNSGIIFCDEFTGLFKEFYHEEYLSDEMEFHSPSGARKT